MSKSKMIVFQRRIIVVMGIIAILLSSWLAFQVYAESQANNKADAAEAKLVQTKSELKAQVESVSADLEETEKQLEVRNSEIEALNTEVANLTNEVESLTNDVEALESEMYDSSLAVGVVMTTNDINMIAKTVWGEARGLNDLEKSMVIWCILNRVDAGQTSIAKIVTAEGQFHGYSPNFPVEEDIVALVKDVLARWQLEKVCSGDVGRTLPKDYLWFRSRDGHNVFRNKFDGNYDIWDQTDWNEIWNPYA